MATKKKPRKSNSKTGGAYKKKVAAPKKPSRSKFTVEGKSTETLLKNGSTHLHRYTEQNLRAIVTRISSAANKRLKRARQSGNADSPAIQEVERSGGKFSAKGKDHEGLKREFLRIKAFFEDKTSTRQGWERVKKKASAEAKKRGVIVDNAEAQKPSDQKPAKAKPKTDLHPTEIDLPEGWVEGGEYQDPEVTTSWIYDSNTDTYKHPIYGEGWKYDSATDSYINYDTGEIVESPGAPRQYHDYDATGDWRRASNGGTETGTIWSMVDSIAQMDKSFTRQTGGYAPGMKDNRLLLFDAIDDEWVTHPGISFEEARDRVLTRLDDIKAESNRFLGEASKIGTSEFM